MNTITNSKHDKWNCKTHYPKQLTFRHLKIVHPCNFPNDTIARAPSFLYICVIAPRVTSWNAVRWHTVIFVMGCALIVFWRPRFTFNTANGQPYWRATTSSHTILTWFYRIACVYHFGIFLVVFYFFHCCIYYIE